jgi:succinate dehydrogenase / fumarate reductase membrane anchor subunit
MAYMTDRKRAAGLGSAKSGTEHFWSITKSSVALAILVPLFVFTFGRALGQPWEVVVAYYARPFPAIVAALTILVGMIHFRQGAQVLIEDYTGGFTRKALILAMIGVAYALAAIGLFALVRLAI